MLSKKKIQVNKVNRTKRNLLIQKQQKRAISPHALLRFGTNVLQIPIGFSVQTGSFGAFDQAETVATTLELQFKQPILLYVSGVGATQVCSVLVGHFKTLGEAEKFQIELKNEHIDGFVRNLSSFNAAP